MELPIQATLQYESRLRTAGTSDPRLLQVLTLARVSASRRFDNNICCTIPLSPVNHQSIINAKSMLHQTKQNTCQHRVGPSQFLGRRTSPFPPAFASDEDPRGLTVAPTAVAPWRKEKGGRMDDRCSQLLLHTTGSTVAWRFHVGTSWEHPGPRCLVVAI